MANANPPPPTNYIRTLPPDFEYTPEEQSLLDLYGTVKLYEKEAARLREAAAKAKLQAADERYQRERGDAPGQPDGADDGSVDDDGDSDEEEDDDDEEEDDDDADALMGQVAQEEV